MGARFPRFILGFNDDMLLVIGNVSIVSEVSTMIS